MIPFQKSDKQTLRIFEGEILKKNKERGRVGEKVQLLNPKHKKALIQKQRESGVFTKMSTLLHY